MGNTGNTRLTNLTTVNAAPVLNQIISVATGKNPDDIGYNMSELISIGTIGLKHGYNEFVTAMSQVMMNTIFKPERPYKRKFNRMVRTSERWGDHYRKVTMLSRDLIGDGQWSEESWDKDNMFNAAPVDGVMQFNYYGKDVFEIPYKIYKNQLDNAMTSEANFNSYYRMQLQTVNNDWEQAIENYNRVARNNFIIGVLEEGGTHQKINLLKLYNEKNGTSLTIADVYKKDNYTDFVRFAYGTIKTYMEYMTERTVYFHTPFVDEGTGELLDLRRATPKEYMNLHILTNEYEQINARVLSETFNEKYLDTDLFERVNFWESLSEPDIIHAGGTCLRPNQAGKVINPEAHAKQHVFAFLYDDECIGTNTFDEWSATSPLEAHRGYWNNYIHAQVRYWNSFEDNAVVFYLEDDDSRNER